MGFATLEFCERVVLDRGPIEEMCQALGVERAERLVGGAMEELAVWISRTEPLWRRGQHGELERLAQRIELVADRLGMALLARVSREVSELCVHGDGAALAAVVGRLVRVGESSLVAIWDLQDVRL